MIEILGKNYLSVKEASKRYGYSIHWFQARIFKKEKPSFLQLEGKGRIYYPVEETDQWFKDQLRINE